MIVRKAMLDDAYGIAKVQVDSWRTTYKNIVPDSYLMQMKYESREKVWRGVITDHPVFVAENEKGIIVGFSSGGPERTGKYPGYTGELYAIYILENYQRKGIGKMLVNPLVDYLLENNMNAMTVSVLAENSSRHFYESLGAKQIDTVKIEIGGKTLAELVYGWEDIAAT